MINIFEKDGAVIITIENATPKEKELIKEAHETKKGTTKAGGVFAKFKCNQKQTEQAEQLSLDDMQYDVWQSVFDDAELPFN